MPTKKHRVNIVLEDDVYDVLSRIAHHRGTSRGALIREFLDAAMPVMTKTADMLDLAARATHVADKDLAGLIEIIDNAATNIDADFSSLISDVKKALDKPEKP